MLLVLFGLNLSSNLSDEIISDIRKTLVQYKVIFFRGQEQLDANGQVAFARRFGEVTTAHSTVPSLPDHPEVLDLNYGKTPRAQCYSLRHGSLVQQ